MEIRLTRLTDARHRLEVLRPDGTRDAVELETRSLLLHDLVHLAVESELGTDRGFWGLVAAGAPLSEVRDTAPDGELMRIEQRVGPMQAVWKGTLDAGRYAAMTGVDLGFVGRVQERLRRLTGHWRATGFRATMTVSWPLKEPC